MLDPNAPMNATPISAFDLTDVSRPVAARLLGLSRHSLNAAISKGRIAATGKTELRVSLAELEAFRGQPVSVFDYLLATRDRRTGRDTSAARPAPQCPDGRSPCR